jgi:hypothetical protein
MIQKYTTRIKPHHNPLLIFVKNMSDIDYAKLDLLKTYFDKHLLMRKIEKGNEPIVIDDSNQEFDTGREEHRLKQYNRREILKLEEATFHMLSADEKFFVNEKTFKKNVKHVTKYIKMNLLKQGDIIYIGQCDGKEFDLTGFGIIDLSHKNLFYEAKSIFYERFQNEEDTIEDIFCCDEAPFKDDIYIPSEMELEWEDLDDIFTKYYNMNYSQAIYDIRKFKRDYEIYVSHSLRIKSDGVERKITT